MTRTVGIYLFDDVELLDFAGPYEVFTTASRVAQRLGMERPFETLAIGRHTGPVAARAGVQLLPDHSIDAHPALHVIVVPGGVVEHELRKPDVTEWIARCARLAELTASVCTGAFLLAEAGLLDGQPATTHWEDIDDLRAAYPSLQVRDKVRWVDNGAIITSAGIAAGIDMSLHVVERLCGRDLALRTARQMDYPFQ